MNERIKELIKQSYDELNEPNNDPMAREWLMKDLLPEYQRFAELIIQESMFVINKCIPPGYEDYPDYRDQIEGAVRRACVKEIKRHFGVGE